MGCNYLSLPLIPTSGTTLLIWLCDIKNSFINDHTTKTEILSCLSIKTAFRGMSSSIIKLRGSWHRIIFTGIPILVRRHLYIEMGRSSFYKIILNHFIYLKMIKASRSFIDVDQKQFRKYMDMNKVGSLHVCHGQVMAWGHFPYYCPFVKKFHQYYSHKAGNADLWCFCCCFFQTNKWVAGDLRRHETHVTFL